MQTEERYNLTLNVPGDGKHPIKILYENYRHEVSWRVIVPIKVFYGETKWHKGTQWFLKAFDLMKKEERDFSLLDIKSFLKE